VRRYLDSEARPDASIASRYSASGRDFPNVSANTDGFVVAVDGTFQAAYGTSAATPVFGSIVTLINDARLHTGKKTIEFMNPTLYENPSVMTDVVKGVRAGCSLSQLFRHQNWDPATGLGTPVYKKILDLHIHLL
jgi:tripeptidyl-peptidase-1